jgi:hypothetical protein
VLPLLDMATRGMGLDHARLRPSAPTWRGAASLRAVIVAAISAAAQHKGRSILTKLLTAPENP